jgi:hypothetical protein
MNLTRLAHHRHPRPPHHELRQKEVLDSANRPIGQVDDLYVDEHGNLRFAGQFSCRRHITKKNSQPVGVKRGVNPL